MAKDWQESKYGWKTHQDSRTMLEEFRHVSIGLEYSSAQLKGESLGIAVTSFHVFSRGESGTLPSFTT